MKNEKQNMLRIQQTFYQCQNENKPVDAHVFKSFNQPTRSQLTNMYVVKFCFAKLRDRSQQKLENERARRRKFLTTKIDSTGAEMSEYKNEQTKLN